MIPYRLTSTAAPIGRNSLFAFLPFIHGRPRMITTTQDIAIYPRCLNTFFQSRIFKFQPIWQLGRIVPLHLNVHSMMDAWDNMKTPL